MFKRGSNNILIDYYLYGLLCNVRQKGYLCSGKKIADVLPVCESEKVENRCDKWSLRRPRIRWRDRVRDDLQNEVGKEWT